MTDSKPKRPKNLDVLSASASCPSCGAPVKFSAITSVMSVCEYCQTTVVRKGEGFTAQGKQSLVLEDYSPLQIGAHGEFRKMAFTLVGRVQYQYEHGTWNEWRIQFSNGKTAWLSEDGGDYTLTNNAKPSDLPDYHSLAVNHRFPYSDDEYTVTDKRTATIIGCQGELPRLNQSGEELYAIDARYQRKFITLDYENGPDNSPVVFLGVATSLEQLKMQGLKDEQARNKTNLTGEKPITKLDCPNCGYPVPHVKGASTCLMCPACRGEIDLSSDTAKLVTVHSIMQGAKTTLALGDSARIIESELDSVSTTRLNDPTQEAPSNKHHDYTIIGIMRLIEVGESGAWTEYFLYSKTDGFLWLAEESNGWFVARMLNELPEKSGGGIQVLGKTWRRADSYHNRVTYAAGAFNWQVNLSDSMKLIDYRNRQEVITSEQNAEEITYTLAKPVSAQRVYHWFGKEVKLPELEVRPVPQKEPMGLHIKLMILGAILIVILILVKSCDSNSVSRAGARIGMGLIDYWLGDSNGRTGFSPSGSHK